MLLSTRGKYGVKAMYEVFKSSTAGPVSLKIIAERQGLSESYLEQLFAVLRRVGLVKSVRGSRGGYVLGKDPETITIGDIVRALEGPLVPCDCVLDDVPVQHCGKASGCVARGVWEKVRDSVATVLDSITLAGLGNDESLSSGDDRNQR